MKAFRLVVLLTSIAIFESCSKEESTPDFVAESVGTYSYSVRVQRAYKTTPDIITGTLSLSRNGDDTAISIDDIETVEYSRLKLGSDGYWFDIQSATITDDNGNLVYRSGHPSFVKDNGLYHGRYDTKTKQLILYANYKYSDPLAQFSFSAAVTATKKKN